MEAALFFINGRVWTPARTDLTEAERDLRQVAVIAEEIFVDAGYSPLRILVEGRPEGQAGLAVNVMGDDERIARCAVLVELTNWVNVEDAARRMTLALAAAHVG